MKSGKKLQHKFLTYPFALQLLSFWVVKGILLGGKRIGVATQQLWCCFRVVIFYHFSGCRTQRTTRNVIRSMRAKSRSFPLPLITVLFCRRLNSY